MKPLSTLCLILSAIALLAGNVLTQEPKLDRPTLKEARKQAELLHSAMHSTLQVVHHRYYHEDESMPLPAAILKEIFASIEEEHNVSLRWLAVDGETMNTDHTPKTDFEREAFKALRSGKPSFEINDAGVYRRAAAIRMGNACLKCHVPDRKSLEARTAGLIISIPIQETEIAK